MAQSPRFDFCRRYHQDSRQRVIRQGAQTYIPGLAERRDEISAALRHTHTAFATKQDAGGHAAGDIRFAAAGRRSVLNHHGASVEHEQFEVRQLFSLDLARPPIPKFEELRKKLPYEFHYEYRCGGQIWVHKIVDWEAGARDANRANISGFPPNPAESL